MHLGCPVPCGISMRRPLTEAARARPTDGPIAARATRAATDSQPRSRTATNGRRVARRVDMTTSWVVPEFPCRQQARNECRCSVDPGSTRIIAHEPCKFQYFSRIRSPPNQPPDTDCGAHQHRRSWVLGTRPASVSQDCVRTKADGAYRRFGTPRPGLGDPRSGPAPDHRRTTVGGSDGSPSLAPG